ncbi:hypothetical protein L1I30_12085 [Gillisia sp. M10.2A]|uniref:Peptidase E n=1 Tax=Gillisia lutea TaxID=2909668 RepID=A0ABS9ELN8_9FLAO|nr:DUF6702 family protein [Gillisia lutea]MCF4102408.1 hypothetical protein [Gillisia lutea]
MKIKILVLLLMLSLSSFTTKHTNDYHKFYISVTEVEYNQKNKSLQIISRVFIDDLEKLLQKRYDKSLMLSSKDEKEAVTTYLKKYLDQKLQIEVNGVPVAVKYIGKEYEDDMALIYLEVTDVSELKSIKVKNAILTDMFEEQKNLVHIEYRGETKSMILTSGRLEEVLNF